MEKGSETRDARRGKRDTGHGKRDTGLSTLVGRGTRDASYELGFSDWLWAGRGELRTAG